MKKTTILIADDHTLIRETWSIILNADPRFRVIATCGTGEEAVKLAEKFMPEIIIMDISLPGINGIEATGLICEISPNSKVLGVSVHTHPAYVKKMIQKGALGYITKNSSKEEMFTAITELQKGNKYVCEEIRNILSEQAIYGDAPSAGINSLSKREIEIIIHLKKGLSSREIAKQLQITTKTVEVHRYNILKKLNLKNTAALINFINKNQPDLG
jgi:two-component system invasion response regulator UvrY